MSINPTITDWQPAFMGIVATWNDEEIEIVKTRTPCRVRFFTRNDTLYCEIESRTTAGPATQSALNVHAAFYDTETGGEWFLTSFITKFVSRGDEVIMEPT